MSLAIGAKLGPYEILSRLGEGGMGEVYRAKDSRLQREVAIKVLPDRFAQDADALARFRRESMAVAALSHPNIRAIYDIGTHERRTFAVMELLEGDTLADRLEGSALDWQEAVRIALAIADGLAAAHSKGIIHRDVKPKNIFLTADGGVKLLDFGLARFGLKGSDEDKETTWVDTATLTTLPGTIVGTAPFMSPEQVRGKPVDERSDVFSFGCVVYEMLAGKQAFSRETAIETMAAVLNEPPATLSEVKTDIPRELEQIVAQCLEKNPSRRFQSAHDLSFALKGMQQRVDSGEGSIWESGTPAPRRAREATEPSVAVLPFVNMSSDRENEYFGDGLAEELINALCKIEGLHVASRTSSFAFKGRSEDVRRIAEILNVRTILEGSVRKAGTTLRISSQLVNADDGYHLWSETFDREMEDVFAIQDEIAQAIARTLEVVLSEGEKGVLASVPTANIEAYECYLRGRQFFHQFRRTALEHALELFGQACDLDPQYSAAYAGVAECCSHLYAYWGTSEAYLKEADEASRKALELAPEQAESYAARGLAVSVSKRYDEAREHFETAIRKDPGLFDAYYYYARVCYEQGELEQAAHLFEQAFRVNPEDYQALSLAATVYAGLGRKSDSEAASHRALAVIKKHLELYPQDGRALYMAAIIRVHLGEQQRGLKLAERALAADPNEPLVLYNVACTYALTGEAEKAIDCIERAITLGGTWRKWIENDPDLNSLRSHPRFRALLERLPS